MSRAHLSGAAVIVATLLLTVLIVTLVPVDSSVDSTQQFQTEKSKRMADPFGYPDLFNEVQREIRTEEGKEPGYPMNYQMEELIKARQALKTASTPIPWAERGPGNVPGRTRAIIIDPSDNDRETWFVASVGGGVWLTRDKGDSWTSLTDHLPNLGVSSMAMSASNTDVIYFGTGEGFYNLDAVAGAGIFKSTDRGNEWTQLESTKNDVDFRFVNRLAIDPDDEDIVVVATNTGIFRTTNGGTSFEEVYSTSTRIQDLQASPQDFQIQFATENSRGVLRSEDGGQTWEMSLNEFATGANRMEIGIAPSNPDIVYIAAEAGNNSSMYSTTDGGDTWNPMFQDDASGTPVQWMQGQGWYDNAIAVDPTDPETVYLGGIELWKSTPRGGVDTVSFPTSLDRAETDPFMDFFNFGAPYFGGILATGNLDAQVDNVFDYDLVSVEMRFGPERSQKAHRFAVSAAGGTNGDGGAGIPFSEYLYRNYVEVPFEVWEIDDDGNDVKQMMVSFRDQADDGEWNLIHRVTEGPRDGQSREYYIINGYEYDDEPHTDIAQNGGLTDKLLFFMWPVLEADATWDPEDLPESALRITVDTFTGTLHAVETFADQFTVHVDHHGIKAIAHGEGLAEMDIFNVNDGGVYYSENKGASWLGIGRGYNTSQFYGVDKRPDFGNSNIDQYIGGTQDNGTWISYNQPNANRGWLRQLGGDGFETVWHSQNASNIIGSIQFNDFWRTTNRGTSWDPATTGIDDNGPFISTLGNSRDAPGTLFTVGSSGIWRSSNFAASWSPYPIDAGEWGFSSIGKARVSLANPDVVWAGFRLDIGGKLHRSLDGGDTFAPAKVPDIAVRAAISGLATHPHDDGTAYVLYSVYSAPKILRTTDHGDTWEDLSGFVDRNPVSTNGFPNVAVHDLLVMPHSPNILWAGTEIGIFVSDDYGDSWSYADNGLPAVSVWRMKIIDDVIILATHGRGIWTVDLDEVVSTESAAAELPGGFQLEQNYPNPFNPTTTITFSVPEPARVELAVFDVTGREMATLTDQVYEAGRHELDWDAAHMASGVYFVRMKAGTKVQTRRMMLIK